jgi:hypothetical protein
MMDIYVSKSQIPGIKEGYDRGVFAFRDFRKGNCVEICPVLTMTESAVNAIKRTVLNPYPIKIGGRWMFLFGYGSLYNHSTNPNVEVIARGDSVEFVAVRDIKKDEELCFDYGKMV